MNRKSFMKLLGGAGILGGTALTRLSAHAAVKDNVTEGDLQEQIDGINTSLSQFSDNGKVTNFSVGKDGSPYITYKVGADSVTKKLGSANMPPYRIKGFSFNWGGDYATFLALTIDCTDISKIIVTRYGAKPGTNVTSHIVFWGSVDSQFYFPTNGAGDEHSTLIGTADPEVNVEYEIPVTAKYMYVELSEGVNSSDPRGLYAKGFSFRFE